MARIIHLDEHVSRVQSSVLELLDSPNCNLLVLSDLQVAVLEQMTFPYVAWATRLVEDHESYQVLVDAPQAYIDELECLELLLSGGSTMTCDLSAVLAELAAAIRNQPSGGAGCAYSGPSAVLNCLPGMSPAELIPQPPTEAPGYGVPPAGFDTWAEYLTHKCKAAYAIYDTVYGLFGALALLPILQITVTLVGTALGGYIAGTAFGAAAFPPAAIIAIAGAAVLIGTLDAAAYIQFQNIQAYLAAHKADIICALYTSGSASEALEGLASAVEDAIQSVAWGTIFGPILGPELAAAVGTMAGQAETNNLVNPLFQVVEDFAYPSVSCAGCGGPAGWEWHFDEDVEGWTYTIQKNDGDTVTAGWDGDPVGPDPSDSSPGLIWGYVDEADPPLGNVYVIWEYAFPIGNRPTVQPGDMLVADYWCDQYAGTSVNILVFYIDETHSSHEYQNLTGWNEISVAGTAGKVVEHIQINLGMGEITTPANYAIDNVLWGQ